MTVPVQAQPARFARHVGERTIVLPRLRVLYLPVPKAGTTGMLWLLARLAGLDLPARHVHDVRRWPAECRLAGYAGDERERVLSEDGWLRFTLVRHPATRLWSAWQSKLLLREPRFVAAHGAEPWFPRLPERPQDLVGDFRRFVAALDPAADVHWAVQRDLVRQLPLDHVGRLERREETHARLREHVGGLPAEAGTRNTTPVPLAPGAFGTASGAALQRLYAADFAAFGYDPELPAGDWDEWEADVRRRLPGLRAAIRVRRRPRAAERPPARRRRPPDLVSVEREPGFDVRRPYTDEPLPAGLTAVVRVKDEARTLPWTLPPLLHAVDRVVLVDNGSTDGTAAVARRTAAEHGGAPLAVHDYPFGVARCGAEHLATPARSVHSLVHFYNWSFALARTAYVLKWDGDMVLTDAAAAILRDLTWQLEAAARVIRVPRHPLYVVDERRAFLDLALRNCEPWGWPNAPGSGFVKAFDWELPQWNAAVTPLELPGIGCLELKFLDADEFAHWSPTDFAASARTRRKRREWEVFSALTAGRPAPEGVVEIVAPPGRHVIAHVREAGTPDRRTRAAA
jgi:hypothetical protein